MSTQRITEVKRRLDGTEVRFDCELLMRTASLAIVLFKFEDGQRGPVDSYGFFWPYRSYLCYHLVPQASDAGVRSRFDVIRDMRIGRHEVSYTDLLLDLWVEQGELRWEDADEVAAFDRAGRLEPADRVRIERGRQLLARNYARILAGVEQTLASLGRRS